MQKAIEKEKWHKVKFEKSTKNNRIEFSEQKTKKKNKKNNKTNKQTNKERTTWKSNFKSRNG